MTEIADPSRRGIIKLLASTPLLPLAGGSATAALLSACGGGGGDVDTAPAAARLKAGGSAASVSPLALPTPTLGLGYDTLAGYTFNNVAGAQRNLLTSGQLQGAGMIQLKGSGTETSSEATDIVGTKGTMSVTGTLPGTDPAAYGVITLLVNVAATARNRSFQQIQVALTRGAVTGSINFNVMLRPGRHTLAFDVATNMKEVATAGLGITTAKVSVNQLLPYAADVSIDALLINSKGRPTWVVTGDDGYATHLTALWPILEAQGIPLTLYIPTGQVGLGSGIAKRLTWAQLVKFKADAGDRLAYGTNTTTDLSITSYATPDLAVANLQQSWADFTEHGLDSPAMYHMALSNGVFTEPYLAALDAAGMKSYRSTKPPTADVGNFTRFGIYQNNVMSRGFATNVDSSPKYPIEVTLAAMDHNDAIGGTMFLHFHQVGETYADCGAGGCTSDYAKAVAARIKASVDAGGVALTVDQWFARDSVQLFPNI